MFVSYLRWNHVVLQQISFTFLKDSVNTKNRRKRAAMEFNTFSRLKALLSSSPRLGFLRQRRSSEELRVAQAMVVKRRREAIDRAYMESICRVKPAPQLSIGTTCKLEQDNHFRVTVTQKGMLPEFLQNDKHTNIHLSVGLAHETGESTRKTCVVRYGKQMDDVTLDFGKVARKDLMNAKLYFVIYFVTRRFFTKKTVLIQKWVTQVDTNKMAKGHRDWKIIKRLR